MEALMTDEQLPTPPEGWAWEYQPVANMWYLWKKNHRSYKFHANGYWELSTWRFGRKPSQLESMQYIIKTVDWKNIQPVV